MRISDKFVCHFFYHHLKKRNCPYIGPILVLHSDHNIDTFAGAFGKQPTSLILKTRLYPHIACKRIPDNTVRRISIVKIAHPYDKRNMFS